MFQVYTFVTFFYECNPTVYSLLSLLLTKERLRTSSSVFTVPSPDEISQRQSARHPFLRPVPDSSLFEPPQRSFRRSVNEALANMKLINSSHTSTKKSASSSAGADAERNATLWITLGTELIELKPRVFLRQAKGDFEFAAPEEPFGAEGWKGYPALPPHSHVIYRGFYSGDLEYNEAEVPFNETGDHIGLVEEGMTPEEVARFVQH